MVDTGLPPNVEERFRNIEAHLGIGKTDEETGEYSVTTPEEPSEPTEPEPATPEDEV